MKPRRMCAVGAAGVLAGALLVTATGAFGVTECGVGQLNLNAGEVMLVGVGGPTLSWSPNNATQGLASCSPVTATTTTTVDPPLTTVPPTTTPPVPTTSTVPATTTTTVPLTGSSGCGLARVAFCDNASEGPSQGGRDGQLNPALWSVSRDVGELDGSDLMPFPATPVSACESGVTTATADNDILVCGSASGHQGQKLTAMSSQNYALLSMRPRQPFDFAGRTGTISYNVDALTEAGLSYWTSLAVTDTPQAGAANSSQVLGMLPDNGVLVNFDNDCSNPGNEVGVSGVYTYTNYVETYIPDPNNTCVPTVRGELNHITVQLSQSNIAIYASPAYTSASAPAAQLLFSTPINLNFTRGYVHFQQQERAPVKYASLFGISPGYANNYWSDFAFDGPVVNTGEVGYSVPDALTSDPSGVAGALNVGYGIISNPSSLDT